MTVIPAEFRRTPPEPPHGPLYRSLEIGIQADAARRLGNLQAMAAALNAVEVLAAKLHLEGIEAVPHGLMEDADTLAAAVLARCGGSRAVEFLDAHAIPYQLINRVETDTLVAHSFRVTAMGQTVTLIAHTPGDRP